jgi:hypothetical protein
MRPYEEEPRIEWPPPRPDPDREPSHPRALLERALRLAADLERIKRQEESRGADT